MQANKRISRHSTSHKKEEPIALADRSDEEMLDGNKVLSQVSLEAMTEQEARIEKQKLLERESQKR